MHNENNTHSRTSTLASAPTHPLQLKNIIYDTSAGSVQLLPALSQQGWLHGWVAVGRSLNGVSVGTRWAAAAAVWYLIMAEQSGDIKLLLCQYNCIDTATKCGRTCIC